MFSTIARNVRRGLWLVAMLGLSARFAAASDVSPRVLTLDEALNTARSRQPALKRARAVADAAEARVAVARAPRLPQILGTASYQRTTANFVARPGVVPRQLQGSSTQRAPSFGTFDFYSFNATASQLVYDFGQTGNLLDAAKEQAKAELHNASAAALAVDYGVRAAFFAAQAARAMVEVARAALDNQARHLVQIQAFVEVGSRPDIDLAQVRTDVANARVAQIQAENAYRLAKVQLNRAMGVESGTAYDVTGDALAPLPEEDLPLHELMRAASAERPELRAAENQLEAAEYNVRSMRGGYAPSLSVSSVVTDAGPKLDQLTWNWNAGVFLTWPLFSGGLAYARTREAQAGVAELAAERDALRQDLLVEIEQARLSVLGAKAVLEAAGEVVKNAEQRLSLAEGRYEAGVGSVIELADAQLALTSAAAQRVRAEYDLSTARASLLRALGSGE